MPSRAALFLLAALISGCTSTRPPAAPAAALLETYWRPVEIDGNPIRIQPGMREPHIVLAREGNRASGYAGCNTFAGSFRQEREALRIGPLAVTRRACVPDGANALETSFLHALAATTQQKITGESLELRDAGGKVRMRLEARTPR